MEGLVGRRNFFCKSEKNLQLNAYAMSTSTIKVMTPGLAFVPGARPTPKFVANMAILDPVFVENDVMGIPARVEHHRMLVRSDDLTFDLLVRFDKNHKAEVSLSEDCWTSFQSLAKNLNPKAYTCVAEQISEIIQYPSLDVNICNKSYVTFDSAVLPFPVTRPLTLTEFASLYYSIVLNCYHECEVPKEKLWAGVLEVEGPNHAVDLTIDKNYKISAD
jgi:hypothetical protein